MSTLISRMTVYALIGGVLGLLLTALTDLDNPFWLMAIGIGVGAVLASVSALRRDIDRS